MKLNTPTKPIYTHEGAKAQHINPILQLRRSVMSCMLWEGEAYEDGVTIASRIADLVKKVNPVEVAAIAVEARNKMKLRHVPLLLARELARIGKLNAETLAEIIQRPDELCEFLAIYWKDKRQPLSSQVKKGLALAFNKFSSYELAKYNRDGAIKLKDVLFLCHAKPNYEEQSQVWKQLIAGTLPTPDTWEVALSSGADKKATWERLISEKKLGALAFLRNLRNMQQAGIETSLIRQGFKELNVEKVLPFRFIAAARYAPDLEPDIEPLMLKCLEGSDKLLGKTLLLIDVSGSMDAAISGKSEMLRVDAACGLAILLREICEEVVIGTFSHGVVKVPPRRGFALRDAIVTSQSHGGTDLGGAIRAINPANNYGRIIVITDEQSATNVPAPKGLGYMINVASAKNGVGYGAWKHIDGFSEAIVSYITTIEASKNDTL